MKLFQEVLPYLSTNMTNGQIMRLAAKCTLPLAQLSYTVTAVPANDSFYYASIREMSVLVPDLTKYVGNSKMSICRLIRIEFDSSVCTLRMNQVYMVKFHLGVWQEERCNEKG